MHIDVSVYVTPVTDEEPSQRFPARGNAFYSVVTHTALALLPSRGEAVLVIFARGGCRRFRRADRLIEQPRREVNPSHFNCSSHPRA